MRTDVRRSIPEMERVTVTLPAPMHHRVRVAAAEGGETIQAWVERAVERALAEADRRNR